ncbi:MAG: hypothetical protein KAU26_11135, partial [Methylococcales bacterium]|nr:hypothetical protein [Methylococcales bacterium]
KIIMFHCLQEYAVILIFVLLLLTIVTPFNSFYTEIKWGKVSDLSGYQYLFDAWNSQIKLWLVFWPFFMLINVSLYFTDYLARSGDFTVSSWDEIHLILLMPSVFWIITVWRNSVNTQFRIFAISARFMTLSLIFDYSLKLIIRIDYPRIFFQCEEALLDYASCF